MGLVTPFLPTDTPVPVVIFRLFRAFRIVRLFGRCKSIRLIVNALSGAPVNFFSYLRWSGCGYVYIPAASVVILESYYS